MNIYIRIEVLAREFAGRLLLGLVAAERGHRVLILDKRTAFRILDRAARPPLPPGVFHDNTPGGAGFAKTQLHAELVERGFRITGQDEEHGLATDDFQTDGGGRFPPEAMQNMTAVFAFGSFDAAGIREAVPDHAAKVLEVGSPRVDLWRPDLASAFPRPPAARPSDRPFILWTLTQSPFYSDGPDPLDLSDRSVSAEEMLRCIESLPTRGIGLSRVELDHLRMAVHTRVAVETVAQEFPEFDIVYRPHPVERGDAWPRMFAGGPANIHVILDNAVSPWIRHAACTITTGSTIAFEAAVAGCPLIAFHPEGMVSWPAVSRLGLRVDSVEGLVERLRSVLDGSRPVDAVREERAEETLRERFAALEGRLAADRIVDAWESIVDSGIRHAPAVDAELLARGGPQPGPLVRARRGVLARLRGGPEAVGSLDPRRKFPEFDLEEAHALHADLAASLGRFRTVRLRKLGPHLLHLSG